MLVWNWWHMWTQRVSSENRAPSFVWKHSGWVMAEVDPAFTEWPWPWETSNTAELSFRQSWIWVRSAYRLRFPVMWPVSWSSSSGSCLSLCYQQRCRRLSSRPSSSPPMRTGPLPPSCCLVSYLTETWTSCVTFLTSYNMCLRGAIITPSLLTFIPHILCFVVWISVSLLTFFTLFCAYLQECRE